ncbi:MAG: MBL fold metallo-hydrolase [Dehalococcoidia bacterium]
MEAIRLHYNTVYLVEDAGERVLVDTGPDYEGAWEELQAAVGSRMPDLVVATHGHHDHAGMGARWQRAGVPVILGRPDWWYTSGGDEELAAERALLERVVRECGAPQRVTDEAMAGLERRMMSNRLARGSYPPAGSRPHWPTGLRYERYQPKMEAANGLIGAGLRLALCAGHTPGNCVVIHEGEGWLFSGDQLLPDITPTPGLQLDPRSPTGERFRSLPAFRDSLRRLRHEPFSRCYPGHGEPFDAVAQSIESNIVAIDSRTERVFDCLRENGPISLYALCDRLYPRALQRRFWQILPTVLGHLDVLDAEGRALQDGSLWATRGR